MLIRTTAGIPATAVLTASAAQIGPVIAAAVHNPTTAVLTASAAQIQPTSTDDDIDSTHNDTANDSFNGFSHGGIAGSYGPQSHLNSPMPLPVVTPLTSPIPPPSPESELPPVKFDQSYLFPFQGRRSCKKRKKKRHPLCE